jgi:alginate O-acetyltransferase complex protein AlgI
VLFQTLDFALFFAVVFAAFLAAPQRARWALLLAASVVFFGALGVPELLLALAAVTLASYLAAAGIARGSSPRLWLWGGIAFNVGVLAAFKYAPAAWFGRTADPGLLAMVGVSYFTFQGISYIADVHVGVQERERHLGYFAL